MKCENLSQKNSPSKLKFSKHKILVLGGTGFLGSYVSRVFDKNAIIHSTSLVKKSDPSVLHVKYFQSARDIVDLLDSVDFDVVINCVALASIETCESDHEAAYFLNATVPQVLARYTNDLGKKLITISTDAVFNGRRAFPNEETTPSPLSRYGETKLLGEQLALQENESALVCRVNFFGHHTSGLGLFDFIFSKLYSGSTVQGYKDVFFTPAYAFEVAKALAILSETEQSGILHVAGAERISKYDFAQKIAQVFGFDPSLIVEGSINDSGNAQIRSKDLSLDTSKMNSIGIRMSTVDVALRKMRKQGDYKFVKF